MSLTLERLAIESRIAALDKERARYELRSDMQITIIRQESSPMLAVDQINIERLEVAIDELIEYAHKIKEIDTERQRIEKHL